MAGDSTPATVQGEVPVPARRIRRRSVSGLVGGVILVLVTVVCFASSPFTLLDRGQGPPYAAQDRLARTLPPVWAPQATIDPLTDLSRLPDSPAKRIAEIRLRDARAIADPPTTEQLRVATPVYLFGTDTLGRDVLVRCLAGGCISLGVGLAAAMISVVIGTAYGAVAGYLGGRTDAVMMRLVDVLYGLPYVLLVVLLAVASDAMVQSMQARGMLQGTGATQACQVGTLLVAIGGVSWLTMARVVRGQVLSLKARPFIEAARAVGVPTARILRRHILPNLVGPMVVYATLTVPQAILQESFLSFLGIGVRPPLPSWGSLAADGLSELNPYQSNWWLLVFPCLLLGATLLALNLVGDAMREALDPQTAGSR